MLAVLWGIWLLYAGVVLLHLRGWKSLPANLPLPEPETWPKVSIVVAMRNEAAGLRQFLTGLAEQTYPAAQREIILVNDHSTDGSADLATALAAELALTDFTLVNLPENGHALGKKAALAAGIGLAQGRYIITTDADCRVPPQWLAQMVGFAEYKQAMLVSGPVKYDAGTDLFSRLQAVEFASLIGVGAAAISLRKPNMCNGANLLFRKEAFAEVGGYAGNERIASGDDEFLLHKIASRYPAGYHFLKSAKTTVTTNPSTSLDALFNQRVRWAGKSGYYTRLGPKLLAGLVVTMQGAVLLAFGLAVAGTFSWLVPLWLICAKFVVELCFFGPVLRFFGLRKQLGLVALLQIVYPPFVLAVALGTLAGRYQWKDRYITNP